MRSLLVAIRSSLHLLDARSGSNLAAPTPGQGFVGSERGLLLIARLGDPDGEILVEGVHNALCEACRVLMSRGIVGPFETWKQGILYPCLRGDIETTASLTVEESITKSPRFTKWQPHPHSQDAIYRASGSAPAPEDVGAGSCSRRHHRAF